MQKLANCPSCKSTKTARIAYGYVVFNKQGKKDFDGGKIILGGCCVEENDPNWYCHECQNKW